jgi:hypothetical protein
MEPSSRSAFDYFVTERVKDLKRLAGHTRGEQQLTDVINQSWLIARELCLDDTLEELLNPDFQERLLQRLNHFFVNHRDRILRKSDSLDYGNDDAVASSDTYALVHILPGASPDPLTELVNQEEVASTMQVEDSVDIKCSRAGAYACLLEHFGESWRKVAEHLDVSTSTARKHYRQAEFLACRQRCLPSHMPKGFMPGPWHSPRPGRTLRQLLFEFSYQLTLEHGEGWV